jgi:hypothetical protein
MRTALITRIADQVHLLVVMAAIVIPCGLMLLGV